MLHNKLTERLQISYPIIQAPMAGGVTTSHLVAAVSNAGGLGMIGAGYMTPAQIRDQIREIRTLTTVPFGINLFVPSEFHATDEEIASANRQLQPIRERLNVSEEGAAIPKYSAMLETFHEQIEVVIEEEVPVCSFTFGLPSHAIIAALKQRIVLMGTATTVEEAAAVERAGMDAVVVQGSEAGGHRGHFLSGAQASLIGLMSLIPQTADRVRIPIVAAGGIMDGRGLMASMYLGAQAVQMGTAFLTCTESGAHPVYKEAILHAREDEIVLTRAFSGKWARGVRNIFVEEMQTHEASFPAFPVQNALTQSIRSSAAQQENPAFLSLWSGQSPRLARSQTVEAFMQRVLEEAKQLRGDVLQYEEGHLHLGYYENGYDLEAIAYKRDGMDVWDVYFDSDQKLEHVECIPGFGYKIMTVSSSELTYEEGSLLFEKWLRVHRII